MKIVSWNVNGLRSVLGYSPWCHAKTHERLHTMLEHFASDIICFQETKITRDQLSTNLSTVKGYITFYSFCNVKSGYCGVSTHIRESQTYLRPIKAQDGFTGFLKSNNSNSLITSNELLNKLREKFSDNRLKQLDNEGRCLITQHNNFLLFNIYFPNGNGSENRLYFKTDYHECIKIVIEYFIKYKHTNVILLGDMNAKYQMIDSCDPGPPQEFYDKISTQWFKYLVNQNDNNGLQMIDTFKYIYSDFSKLSKKPYTCWDQYTFARSSNYGTRIDYIIVNKQMISDHKEHENENENENENEKKNNIIISDAKVMQSIMGSDHCPIYCEIIGMDKQWNKNKQIAIPKLASRFMPEFAGKQTNLMSFFSSKGSKNIKLNTNSRKRKLNEIVTNNINTNAKKKQKLNNNINKCKPKITKNNSKSNKNQSNLFNFMQKTNKCQSKENNAKYTNKSQSDPDLTDKIKHISTNPKPKSTQSSAEQWKSLFGKKKKNPLCHHGQETILRTVTKNGINRGKKFYVCPRGKGAANDPNAQCKFFQWFNKPVKLKQKDTKNTRKFKSW